MRLLCLAALALAVRLLWARQLAFERGAEQHLADWQAEAIEQVERYLDVAAVGEVHVGNGGHG